MFTTPSFFMNLVRWIQPNQTIVQVQIPKGKRWHGNKWVAATSSGNCPYMIFARGFTTFSVSRVRKSKNEPWRYLVRWPYARSEQQSFETRDPREVLRIIMTNS